MAQPPTFALFVSSVEGRLVTRYGTSARGAPSYIGARRDAADPTHIIWDPALVVALTSDEVARHRVEYERELETRSLTKRTEQDYLAQLAPPPPSAPAPAPAPEPAPIAPASPPTDAPVTES